MERNNKIKSFIALIVGIFLAAVISEIILQLINYPRRPVSGWMNCIKLHPEECNSMGFRGKEIDYSDHDFVVILLGDSELYASAMSFEQRPERRLELYLQNYRNNTRVFTIADMGYGQDQQFLALKKYYENYRADLVLLMFTVRNDVEDNVFPVSGHNNTIKPTYWLEKGKLIGPSEEWLESVGSRFKLVLLWDYYIGEKPGESRLRKWREDILPPHYQGVDHYEGDVDYSWQEAWDSNPHGAYNSYKFERVGNSGNELTPRSELRTYGIDLTRELLSQIKELIEANHGHFIIFKEERPWETQDLKKERVYFLNDRYYKLSAKQSQENLSDIFHGFEQYSFPLSLNNYQVSKEDEHLSSAAIDQLMKELSIVISKKEYLR